MRRTSAGLLSAPLTFALSFAFSYGPEAPRMSLPGAVTVSIAAAAAVWTGWRHPQVGLLVVVALALALPLLRATFEALDLVVVLLVFRAATETTRSAWVLAAAAFTALTVNDVWLRVSLDRSFASPTVVYPLLLTALAVGLGMQSRRVREQHRELLALREVDRARAASEERRRIARDLHDVAAHHLSALVVRSKLALKLDTVTALEESAQFTARTAADTLSSLRDVVRVLSTEGGAPLTPAPALADLTAIVGRMEAAGLRVERAVATDGSLGADVSLAAVRIVQEALSNVLRHRGPGRVWLDVDQSDTAVTVTVEDDGPIAHASLVMSAGPGSYGIAGMQERAAACGGELSVGPSARGGWRVHAVLPLAVPGVRE